MKVILNLRKLIGEKYTLRASSKTYFQKSGIFQNRIWLKLNTAKARWADMDFAVLQDIVLAKWLQKHKCCAFGSKLNYSIMLFETLSAALVLDNTVYNVMQNIWSTAVAYKVDQKANFD